MAFAARANDSTELWKELTEVGIIKDATGTFGSSTLSGAEPRGSASVDVAAITNFSDGDLIRIGSGTSLEENEVSGTPAGSTITLARVTEIAQIAGAAVVERQRVAVGHVAESGMNVNQTEEIFEIRAATAAKPLVKRTTGVPQDITFPTLNLSMRNLALAVGMDEESTSVALGSGTAADPYVVRWNADFMDALTNISVYAKGLLESGDFIEAIGWNLEVDLNKSMNMARNAATEMVMGGRVSVIEWRQWT